MEGTGPIGPLEVSVLAEMPFSPEIQEMSWLTPDGLTRHARKPGAAVNDYFDEIWEDDVPESAVDLRDVAPEHRRNRVEDVFADVEPGERFHIVSDRDPAPVREYLLDLLDGGQRLESFETRRQNPDT